jgi:TPP-dependent pyruvate/acetoin dehydrogenase alpha subunit
VRRLEAAGVELSGLREAVAEEIAAGVEEALAMPMPDPDSATEDVFADEPALLQDGRGPWSGFAGARG